MSTVSNSLKYLTDDFVSLQISNKCPLNEKSADQFFKLYQRFFDKAITKLRDAGDFKWMAEEFSSVRECPFSWKDLDISMPIEKIEEVLERTQILQLRPIHNRAKTLVVGCGNVPLADMGGYPLKEDDYSEKYKKEHQHLNAITINPHLASNPTLVGFFGGQCFPMLKDAQFDLIAIEGTQIFDTADGRDELKRLLSPQGKVIHNIGGKQGYEFSWEDNAKDLRAPDYELPKVLIEDLNVFESFNYEE
jgi:hypothetical protein